MSDDFDDIDFEAHDSDLDDLPSETVIDLPPFGEEEAKRAKKRRRRIFWLKFMGFCLILCLIVALIGAAGAFFYCKPRYDLAHSFDLSEIDEVEVASRIFDRNGQELGRIFVQNRRPVSIEEVSPHFINALLAAEDSRFYEHDGVDYWGIVRALYYGIRSKSINQGASTITQQLSRQSFELKDRTISRKITEIFLAQRIERYIAEKEGGKNAGKQKILELYLNRIYFGSGYYGIASAGEGYFGKDPARLSLGEGATLAATIPNPYHRSPRTFPETSMRWRNHVLNRMEVEGYIDEDKRDRTQRTPVRTIAKGNITGKSAFVYERVRQEVIDLLGKEAVSKGGFEIHTTIDGDIQQTAEDMLKDQLTKIEQHPDFNHNTLAEYKVKKKEFRENAHPDQTFPAPTYLQGAILMIDNKTGATITRIGSRDFSDSMFDRVSQGKRPTGTAFKPFVYAAAFEGTAEKDSYFPGTLLDDTPMDTRQVMVGGTTGILGEWGPENFDNVYENVITARTALAKSKNAATVRMGQKIGLKPVVDLAEKAGLVFEGDLKRFNATFLGRNPVSPEDLALAYTIFPNSGRRPEKTHIIANIKDSLGNVIYTPNVAMQEGQVVDRYTSYQVSSILSDAFKTGPASKAREKYDLGNFPIAGKTGTEYNFTDNWFVGYTSEVTCVIWCGFDQKKSIYPGAFSSDTVLPIWSHLMNEAAKRFEPKAFLPPPDALQVEICLKSGERATDSCFETVDNNGKASQIRCTYNEYLRPGTDLGSICRIHGSAASRILTQNKIKRRNGIIVPQIVVRESAEPVFPIGPTIIGTEDPYNSIAPIIRARVAPVVVEEEEEDADEPAQDRPAQEIGNNGLPVARPVMFESEEEDLPAQRVTIPPPRAIVIE